MMRLLVWILVAVGVLILPNQSPAQVVNLAGIDLALNSVKRQDQSSIAGWSARMRIDGDDFPIGLMLMPTISRWQDKTSVEALSFGTTQRDFTLGLDAAFQWQWKSVKPYAGAGFGVHFMRAEFAAPTLGVPPTVESATRFAPDILLGLAMPTSSWLQPYTEASYAWLSPSNQFRFNVGLGANF